MIATTALPCLAGSLPARDGSVRLNLVQGRPVVDGVFLNGQGPYRFLLDTGAQTNQVEESIARKLGLKAAFRVELATVTGTALAPGGRIGMVALGSATASDQEFLFTSLDGIHELSPGIQGVLGEQFLAKFDYLMDLAKHRLAMGAVKPDSGSRVDLKTIHGCPAIETSEGELLLDSGTDALILLRGTANGTASGQGGRVRTNSGSASFVAVDAPRLRIAGVDYHPANAAALPRGSREEDGELPLNLFHAVFISNSGHYAILNPRERE